MARKLFGSDLCFVAGADRTPLLSVAGLVATVYSDSAGTMPADVVTYPAEAAYSGSRITVDTHSCLPLFLGPNDDTAVLYVSVAGGPVTPIFSSGTPVLP